MKMDLPLELVIEIINFIPYEHVLNFALTCKQHHHLGHSKLETYKALTAHRKLNQHLKLVACKFFKLYEQSFNTYGPQHELTKNLHSCYYNLYIALRLKLEPVLEACGVGNYTHDIYYVKADLPPFKVKLKTDIPKVISEYYNLIKFVTRNSNVLSKGQPKLMEPVFILLNTTFFLCHEILQYY